MSKANLLTLDTHTWYWLATGSKSLSLPARNIIDKASSDGLILIPAICLWEICMLIEKGRINVHLPPAEWLNNALSGPGLALTALTPEIAVESCNLPGSFHQDPADRLIVATARVHSATLITRDAQILKYGRQGHVKTLST